MTLSALHRLQQDGFRLQGDTLRDKAGNAVEFSIVTNAGNRARESMATMIQQDLKKIGIKVNVVTLDFNSLLERMTQTFNYEACLLGFQNVELDPNSQMAVWLSSADNHQWNPEPKVSCNGVGSGDRQADARRKLRPATSTSASSTGTASSRLPGSRSRLSIW